MKISIHKKAGWKTKTLGDICDIQTGKWDANHAVINGKYRFYTCAYKYTFCNTKRFVGECLILPGNGVNVGEIFYYHGKFDAYQRTYVINNIIISPKILYYQLLCFWKERNLNKQFGSATNYLKIGNFLNYEIYYPESRREQYRIVKVLDKVFEEITKVKVNTEKNLQNSKNLFESYLYGVFTNPGKLWKEYKLGEIYDVRDGTHDSPKYQKEGYALITSKNLKKDELDYQKIKYISENDYRKINDRSKVHKGDILFAMIGTIGNPVVVKIDPDFAIKNVALFKIPKEQNSYFLKYYLDSRFVIDKMVNEAKGTTQRFVGLGYLRDFKILVPTLTEQKLIVAKLDALSSETKKLESIYKQKLADLEELKKSILKSAFNGEL